MNWYQGLKHQAKAKDFFKGLGWGAGLGGIGVGVGLMGNPSVPNQSYQEPTALVSPAPTAPTPTVAPQSKQAPKVEAPKVQAPLQQPPKAEAPKAVSSPGDINVKHIIQMESAGKANARSPVGAVGMMQIMPATWNEISRRLGKNYSEADMLDPDKNIEIGTYYINKEIPRLLRAKGVPDTQESRLAAYNWGIGNVSKAYKRYGDNWVLHLPKETSDYLKKYKKLTGG